MFTNVKNCRKKRKTKKNRLKTLYNSLQNTLQFVKNLAIAFAKNSKIAYNFWINFIENKRKFAIMRYNIKNRFISIMWKNYRVRWEYAKYCIKNLFKKSSEKIPKLSPRCITSYIRITSCLGMQLYQQLFLKKEACIQTQWQTKNYLYFIMIYNVASLEFLKTNISFFMYNSVSVSLEYDFCIIIVKVN